MPNGVKPSAYEPSPSAPSLVAHHDPLELSANALAWALDVPPNRITSIIAEERAVTPDTAVRLARYFGTTPQLWLNLQQAYDLSTTLAEHGAHINDSVRPRPTGRCAQ
jgi:antitoxin HigA-1